MHHLASTPCLPLAACHPESAARDLRAPRLRTTEAAKTATAEANFTPGGGGGGEVVTEGGVFMAGGSSENAKHLLAGHVHQEWFLQTKSKKVRFADFQGRSPELRNPLLLVNSTQHPLKGGSRTDSGLLPGSFRGHTPRSPTLQKGVLSTFRTPPLLRTSCENLLRAPSSCKAHYKTPSKKHSENLL